MKIVQLYHIEIPLPIVFEHLLIEERINQEIMVYNKLTHSMCFLIYIDKLHFQTVFISLFPAVTSFLNFI